MSFGLSRRPCHRNLPPLPLVQDVLLLCLGGSREEEGGSAVLMQRVPGQLALLAMPSF